MYYLARNHHELESCYEQYWMKDDEIEVAVGGGGRYHMAQARVEGGFGVTPPRNQTHSILTIYSSLIKNLFQRYVST